MTDRFCSSCGAPRSPDSRFCSACGAGFAPTHRAPWDGMASWEAPSPTATPGPRLGPGLEVQVLDQRSDGWAHVRCANRWETWVDGRLLTPFPGPGTAPTAGPSTAAPLAPPLGSVSPSTPAPRPASNLLGLAGVGCALILAGAMVPWYRVGNGHLTPWRIPLRYLIFRTADAPQPRVIIVLLPAVVTAVVGLALLSAGRRAAGRLLMLVGAALATNLAAFGVARWLHPATGHGLGLGIPLVALGGALVAVAHFATRDRTKTGAWGWLR